VEAELRSVLQQRAQDAGATLEQLRAAEASSDAKAQLLELLVELRASSNSQGADGHEDSSNEHTKITSGGGGGGGGGAAHDSKATSADYSQDSLTSTPSASLAPAPSPSTTSLLVVGKLTPQRMPPRNARLGLRPGARPPRQLPDFQRSDTAASATPRDDAGLVATTRMAHRALTPPRWANRGRTPRSTRPGSRQSAPPPSHVQVRV
jgi:hypothetical protein